MPMVLATESQPAQFFQTDAAPKDRCQATNWKFI